MSHPEKSKLARLSQDIDFTHIIITRFSYRFKKDDPVGTLFSRNRMERRFQLLESFCFPSMFRRKTYPNFYWVLIIDKDLPVLYTNRLHRLIANAYESLKYSTAGTTKSYYICGNMIVVLVVQNGFINLEYQLMIKDI